MFVGVIEGVVVIVGVGVTVLVGVGDGKPFSLEY